MTRVFASPDYILSNTVVFDIFLTLISTVCALDRVLCVMQFSFFFYPEGSFQPFDNIYSTVFSCILSGPVL